MKVFVRVISSLILIPVFLVLLISGTFKFALLNNNFWISGFEKHGAYENMRVVVNDYLDSRNANIFKSLITVQNIKDFTDKNITNILNFTKGKMAELTFYIPVQKIPKEMLPKKLGTLKEPQKTWNL
jgi:hypothetical protein